jgi:hypothetical protein
MPTTNKQVEKVELIEVKSSNVQSIGYDRQRSILTVRFDDAGRTYEYQNVAEDVYALLAQAARQGESVGQVFNLLIRSHPEKYPYRKV